MNYKEFETRFIELGEDLDDNWDELVELSKENQVWISQAVLENRKLGHKVMQKAVSEKRSNYGQRRFSNFISE